MNKVKNRLEILDYFSTRKKCLTAINSKYCQNEQRGFERFYLWNVIVLIPNPSVVNKRAYIHLKETSNSFFCLLLISIKVEKLRLQDQFYTLYKYNSL